ncbi:O-antigen ligase [Cetobacterium sp. ZOR0034]|uniref:O-antigen ligase family protein n=1 Tax=Cetobacterium sp. ZOR0034 TaxID=1339239 RepID=UPI000647B8BB|nr:O-antigen ligase family protein [Cetobacterium sp. ZOR0034]
MRISREHYNKIEEGLLYLIGLSLFISYDISKILASVTILVLIGRKIFYKESLECGNENIKKFIIGYVLIGIVWNFIGGMSYKPVRNFLKMARYIPFLFLLYPLFQKKKELFDRFLICGLGSYSILLGKVVLEYKKNLWRRASGFEGVNPTGTMGAMVAVFSFGLFISERSIIKKMVYIAVYISGIWITVATQGRAPLVGALLGTGIIVILELYSNFNIKKLLLLGVAIAVLSVGGLKTIPPKKLVRFKTAFNTEKTVKNSSNGLRLEMWKIGLKRVKENPLFGAGTKYDRENLFRKFAEELPESSTAEKRYKNTLLTKGFNDAHSMYINAAVDMGIYIVSLLILWFLIPGYLMIKNIKRLKDKRYLLGSIGGIVVYLTVGAFWMLWRTPEQMYFWILLTTLLTTIKIDKNESSNEKERV